MTSSPHNRSQPGNASDALADRIEATKRSWLPIAGHVVNVTFNLAEADLIVIALRSSNPSQNAVTGSSGTHPVPEGAADNAPPAILKARGDLAVENRNYWQAEAERRAARIAELEAELQRRSGVPSAKPLCSCKASARDGQHMAWCPAVTSTDGK